MPDQNAGARLRGGPGVDRAPPAISRSLQYVAILVLVVAVMIGVAAQQLFEVRAALLADTERQMARLDMVFAEQTGRAVETVDLLLRNTIETVQGLRGTPPDPVALGELLRRRSHGVRQVSDLAVTDRSGHVIASSTRVAGAAEPPDVAAALARYASAPEARLQISDPFREPDGSWSALLIRGIPAPGDSWDGLVIAHLSLGYFEDFYKAVELTENGAILLHRRDGTVLARFPHDDSVVGRSYADLPPFRDILSKSMAGTVLMQGPLDGKMRVLAIRALKAFPLAVNVSVDEDMILQPWRRQAVMFGVVAAGASLVIAGLLLALSRRSRQVEKLLQEFRGAKDRAEQASAGLREQIDERTRAEAALSQAQRIEAVGQLTGGVAHDFNNLLTVVLGNVDLISRFEALPPREAAWLATIRSAAERGASLTSQLLAFARRQPLLPTPMDINAVLAGMNDLMLSALGSRVRVITRLQPGLWPAMVDPTQIELVVLNLAINARDAMPDGGTLTIISVNVVLGPPTRAEQPPAGEYVRLTVSDTGTGMSPEVAAKAFEPFFTTKGPGKGSGLGLSQVFGVARQSGGGVEIETAPGTGTTVSVFLPRATLPLPPPPAPAPAAAAPRDGGVTVLLVDDDAAVRATTAELLRQLGYAVREAASGPDALTLLGSGVEVQVVLSDVAMPRMSGPALAREIRQRQPQLPVVFFSGYADPESVAGADGLKRLVRKPFRPAELAAQLEAALAEEQSAPAPAG
jgi:signal transduction histidine kinase/CheY-like chemotaxis protein